MVTDQQNSSRDYKVFFALLVLVLFFMQHLTSISLFAFAGLAVLGMMMFLLDIQELYYAYALLLPNTHILKFVGNNAALVGYWLLLVVLKMVLINLRNVPFSKRMAVHLVVHVIVVLLSISINGNFGQGAAVVRFASTIVLINYLVRQHTFDKEKMLRNYILGISLNILLSIVYYSLKNINWMNMRFTSIGNDRNYFAISLAFAANVLLVYAYKQRNLTLKTIFQFFLFAVGIVLSGSRTAFIIVLPTVITMLALIFRDKNRTGRRYLVIIFLIIGVFVFRNLLSDSMQRLMDRFSNDTAEGGNGRFEMWSLYLGYSFSSARNLIFGVGESTKLIQMGIADAVEHNTLIEMLFSIGLIGTLTLLPLYGDVYILFKGEKERNGIITYFPLICIIVGYSTINGLYSENLTFAIILSCMVIGMKKRSSVNKDVIYSDRKKQGA